MLIHVLVAVGTPAEKSRLCRLFAQDDVLTATVDDATALQQRFVSGDFDLLVVSREFLGKEKAGLIRSVRDLPESPEIVVLTDREDSEERASLLAAGCLAVLNLGLGDDKLGAALRAIVERRSTDAIRSFRADRPEERYRLADFVSDSTSMQLFLDLARKVVRSNSSVLILGETGVGKERLARAIHAEGPRSSGPLVAVNCAAFPEGLLESELFGHEEGAFTGATRSKKGYFELAHKGTLLLDEIGEMPPHLQVKLLRVLDEHKFYRVGSEQPIEVDVRIMAATNREPESSIIENRLRPDLFYRLAVVTLTIPPLRERREDIPQLALSYLEHFRVLARKRAISFSDAAMDVLVRYDWPGNVRELVNAVERAVLLSASDEIQIDDLPVRILAAVRGSDRSLPGRGGAGGSETIRRELLDVPLSEARKEVVNAFEASYVASQLAAADGRIGEAAARAGVNERSLYELMKKLGLKKESFKSARAAKRSSGRAPQLRS